MDLYPFAGIREQLKDAARAQHLTQQVRNIFDPRTETLSKPSVVAASTLLGVPLDEESLAYTYSQVVSIEDGGVCATSDLSVPGSHSYVANGIVSHNTVNMSSTATVSQVADVYTKAWELGLKCVAIYRDGCKASQPVSAKSNEKKPEVTVSEVKEPVVTGLKWGERKRLPDERPSVTHKFSIGGQDGYFHLGLHEDGTPGEIFINISKAGSTLHGLVDMAATAISLGMQYGVPLETLLEKFRGVRFEPSGFTGHKGILRADSLADYLAKWMELRGSVPKQEPKQEAHEPVAHTHSVSYHGDPCKSCGNMTMRAGSCWVCSTCGTTTGCG
jgi:ribonucleoside-diphosphate reductase alpha chain